MLDTGSGEGFALLVALDAASLAWGSRNHRAIDNIHGASEFLDVPWSLRNFWVFSSRQVMSIAAVTVLCKGYVRSRSARAGLFWEALRLGSPFRPARIPPSINGLVVARQLVHQPLSGPIAARDGILSV